MKERCDGDAGRIILHWPIGQFAIGYVGAEAAVGGNRVDNEGARTGIGVGVASLVGIDHKQQIAGGIDRHRRRERPRRVVGVFRIEFAIGADIVLNNGIVVVVDDVQIFAVRRSYQGHRVTTGKLVGRVWNLRQRTGALFESIDGDLAGIQFRRGNKHIIDDIANTTRGNSKSYAN